MNQENIILTGVGGQGVITAGILIGNAVTAAGLNAVMAEVHGMSQRGGVVTVELRIGDVHGPIVPNGAADLVLGFEAVETLRAMCRASKNTTVIMSTERIVPISVNFGDSKYPDIERMVTKLSERGVKVIPIDAPRLAREAGESLSSNVVLVGSAFSAGFIPVDHSELEESIMHLFPIKSWEANLKALKLGIKEYRTLSVNGPVHLDGHGEITATPERTANV
jgi:indolepyruvate ferredoxin oxidoreductase beta subunit